MPANRITVAQLKSEMDEKFIEQERKFKAQLGPVERKLKDLRTINEKLEKARKTGKVTGRTFAQQIALEKEVARLTNRVEKLDQNTSDDPAVVKANTAELEGITTRMEELFEAVSMKVSTLRTELDTLRGDHDGLRSDHDDLRIEHDTLVGKHGRLTNRVYNLEQIEEYVPWAAIIIGVIVGIIAGFVWLATPFYEGAAEVARPITPWIVGFAVGLIVAGLITLFSRSRSTVKTSRDEQNTVPLIPTPTPSNKESDAPITAPTKVFETQGATTGAR